MATMELALTALNTEWRALLPGCTAQLTDWAGAEPALAGAHDLDGVLDLIRRRPDEVLAALLRLGAAGDPLAHRVVLQTMLGMLVRWGAGRPGVLPEAISELWLAIVEYPLERRTRSIAANLAWTVRRRLPRVQPPPPLAPPAPEHREPSAAAVLAEARLLGLIDQATHDTLWMVYVVGMTSQQAAAALGTTPGAIRWRCSHALRRLAQRADLLAA